MSAPLVIAGAGAAGMFAAATLAESAPDLEVIVLEKGAAPLDKVRRSGGGRCNLTHACEDIRRFCEHYPRGGQALIGPMHRFGPTETRAWFEAHGVPTVTEPDGRVFPRQGGAEAVIRALETACARGRVRVWTKCAVTAASPAEEGFELTLANGDRLRAWRLLVACGGGAWIDGLGHTIEPWTPSLFTFKTDDIALTALAGVSVPSVGLTLLRRRVEGALLITHQGVSGPAVLGSSAFAARELAASDYRAVVRVHWAPEYSPEEVAERLAARRGAAPRRRVGQDPLFELPARLWQLLARRAGVPEARVWGEATAAMLRALAAQVCGFELNITGRCANRGEFVTCGGVRLSEVDFKIMGSRRHPGLHLAGEVLDIDGLTGGYNLQAAWTTGHLAARAMAPTP